MKQSDKRYHELAEKWMKGTITPEEEKEFAAWYNAGQDAPLEVPAGFADDEQQLEQRMWQQIASGSEEPAEKVVPMYKRGLWRKWAVAAAVLVLAGAIWYLLNKGEAVKPVIAQVDPVAQPVIKPGSDKAVLTLPDGSTIVLDEVQNGTLKEQGAIKVIKTDSGKLAYQSAAQTASKEIVYHTLSIPRGGKYQLTLADGTKVWLNAASGLRFPTQFTGAERIVELTGEAYFEVAKNAAMPFKVKVVKQEGIGTGKSNAEITVLGTHFNINAYADEAAIKTTLVEGSVRVANSEEAGNHNATPVILKPGQQAAISAGKAGMIAVQTVDPIEYTAWKDGQFRFRGMDIETIMRQVARWYDVDIVYEGNTINQHFNGTIARDVPVAEVLKMLELTRVIHFETNGKKIIVKSGIRAG